jgi:superfamily II DNA or RNA helicase
LLHEGFAGIRLVGQTADRGADVLAHKFNKRWLFQIKHWKTKIGLDVIDRTLDALRTYHANIPVVVALNGFEDAVREHQAVLIARGIAMQLWDGSRLLERAEKLSNTTLLTPVPKEYQEEPIRALVEAYTAAFTRRALVVMATGLGKTFTAAEAIRRINVNSGVRTLVIAHTNEIVYQLERAFWPFLTVEQETLVWNGYEQPNAVDLKRAPFVFCCLNSLAAHLDRGGELPSFEIVLIDECHHVGGQMYDTILEGTQAGTSYGPFLIGLTATPWRPNEVDLRDYFGEPLVTIDMVTALKKGFLANIDYRMYTDNIDWDAIKDLRGTRFSPRQINRTLFITEWDNAVVLELQSVWKAQSHPKAIVFCGTIDHAITMRDRINALGFCNAAAIYSQAFAGKTMPSFERNRVLCDFHDGTVDVVCAVDIFNEGVDVPDVNIIVFQRVTHSRRIFVQQLGRGLRISPDKDKVIVLDFVSDIRRFAAGLDLKNSLDQDEGPAPGRPMRIRLPNSVSFRRVGGEDPQTESFLRRWLDDVAAIENAGEDASILKFPPILPGGRA